MPVKKRQRPRAATRSARPSRRRPETTRLRGLTASLTVNDLNRSLAWYCDILGFTIADRWSTGGTMSGASIRAGAVELALNQDDFAKGRDRVKGVGFRLYATTVQDLDALAARIKARGATLAQEPMDMPWGDRAMSLTDPDGFHLTIVQA